MRIAVIGTGYVGLVTGTCFAETGNDVLCMDVDEAKIAALKAGRIPIYEPGLAELVERNTAQGRLAFTTDLGEAVAASRVIFIAVGTPPSEDGSSDLSYVLEAARGIAEAMDGYRIIVTKSTVPVGTADRIRGLVASRTRLGFDVVANPEFLKEGAAVEDFMRPDRIVLGTDNSRAIQVMRELYAPFTRTADRIMIMDTRSAEMTKYAANAMLASRISFMNEIASLCERVGADVECVRRGLGSDRRIGPSFLFPGLGYGGSCFPKDIQALIRTGAEAGISMKMMAAIEEVNRRQKRLIVERILEHYGLSREGTPLSGKTFALWGLAFKPRTDDMREAPSLTVVEELLGLGAAIRAYDPEAMAQARRHFGDRIEYAPDNYAALEGSDALILVTEWNLFRNPDFKRIKGLLREPVIFDGRNQYNPHELREMGFRYLGIGRS